MLIVNEALQAARLLQRFQHRSDLGVLTSITQLVATMTPINTLLRRGIKMGHFKSKGQ